MIMIRIIIVIISVNIFIIIYINLLVLSTWITMQKIELLAWILAELCQFVLFLCRIGCSTPCQIRKVLEWHGVSLRYQSVFGAPKLSHKQKFNFCTPRWWKLQNFLIFLLFYSYWLFTGYGECYNRKNTHYNTVFYTKLDNSNLHFLVADGI